MDTDTYTEADKLLHDFAKYEGSIPAPELDKWLDLVIEDAHQCFSSCQSSSLAA